MLILDPARNVDVDHETLSKIGALCAIQGQVDAELLFSTQAVTGTSLETAAKIIGSTNVRTRMEVWLSLFRDKCTQSELIPLAETLSSILKDTSETRNNLVHGLFATHADTRAQAAIKSKNLKMTSSLDSLDDTLVQTARASRIAAHITWRLWCPTEAPELSPWHGKLD